MARSYAKKQFSHPSEGQKDAGISIRKLSEDKHTGKEMKDTVCLGSTNNLILCWGLHGDKRSLMVKKASASYIVPECMTLRPRRYRYVFLVFKLPTQNPLGQIWLENGQYQI